MNMESATRSAILLVIVLFGVITDANAIEPEPLFVDVADESVWLTRAQTLRLEKLRADPMTAAINIIEVRSGLLVRSSRTPGPVIFNLFPGEPILLNRDRIARRAQSDFSWFGSDPNYPRTFSSANVVVKGNRVFATIHSGSRSYRIRPLGEDLHVVLRIDTRAAPLDEEPAVYQRIPIGHYDPSLPVGHDCRIITVLIAFTAEARQAAGDDPNDIHGVIQLALDDANQSYANAGIDIKLNPVFVYETDYEDSWDGETDLGYFQGENDDQMNEVHGLRDESRADVAVLFLGFIAGYGGLASAILAEEDSAFAIVTVGAAPGPTYSFAHEIGHLQGAAHNPENIFDSIPPFEYGHGYPYPPGGWRTMMSYNNPCDGPCPRLPVWSTPEGTYGGVPIGTAETHHTARVLGETACHISGFRETKYK